LFIKVEEFPVPIFGKFRWVVMLYPIEPVIKLRFNK
jgi:hypothetical protein